MCDAGVCCLVTRRGHLLYQPSRTELWGWGKDSCSWKSPSRKLSQPFRQSKIRIEMLCRADWNLLQWNRLRGNGPLAWDPSDVRQLASGRWNCPVSLTCCLKPPDRWQLPADAAICYSVCFHDVREAVLWDTDSGNSANVYAEQWPGHIAIDCSRIEKRWFKKHLLMASLDTKIRWEEPNASDNILIVPVPDQFLSWPVVLEACGLLSLPSQNCIWSLKNVRDWSQYLERFPLGCGYCICLEHSCFYSLFLLLLLTI